MNQFPQWLPAQVVEHAKQLINTGGLNTLEPLLIRLVTSPQIAKVWKSLSDKAHDPQQLVDFLDYVRLHPSLKGKPTDPIAIPSDQLQRTAYKKISELSQLILKELNDLSGSDDPQAGWRLLESSLIRTELDQLQQTSTSLFLEIKALQAKLNQIEHYTPISSVIAMIGLAATLASSAPDAALPKRRNSDRAKCNQLILDLKKHLKDCFSTNSPSLIATIVNTAFNFADGGISADDVRKLKSNAELKPSAELNISTSTSMDQSNKTQA